MRLFTCLLSIVVAIGFTACSSPPQEVRMPIIPIPGDLFDSQGVAWTGYGEESEDTMTLHIMGNVEQDGVYYLPLGTTVEQALRAAGGVTRRGTTSWQHSYVQRGEERIMLSSLGKLEDILNYELMHDDRLVMWNAMYPEESGTLSFVDRLF